MATGINQHKPTYVPMGDQILVAQFEDRLSIEVNRRALAFARIVKNQNINGIKQIIPTIHCVSIRYDPTILSFARLVKELKRLEESDTEVATLSKTVHIPVVFGGAYGPDLADVSKQVDLSPADVIQQVQSKPYYVYMVGFIAGLPYLGDLDERLLLPRRSTPRLKVPQGSVAIADKLTTIYPVESPGGWHLLGWTPMEIFNPHHNPPNRLAPGDHVQYVPITAQQGEQWDEQKQSEWDQAWNM